MLGLATAESVSTGGRRLGKYGAALPWVIGEIASADEANEAARLKAFYADGGNTVSRADFTATVATERGGFSKGSDR